MRNYLALPAARAPELPDIGGAFQNIGNALAGYRQGMNDVTEREDRMEARAYQRGRDAKADAVQDEARQRRLIEHTVGIAQLIDAETDPVKRQGMWGKFIGSSPRFTEAFKQYGVDPADHVNGPKFLIAQARGYQDPLETQAKQADIAYKQAMTAAASRRGDGKEGETMDERLVMIQRAGVDPQSPEGRRFLLSGDMGKSEGMTATDRKAVLGADEDVAAYDDALKKLSRAVEINKTAGSGIGTSTMAGVWNKTGYANEQTRAVAELENLLSRQAVKEMSENLKGATTDKELFLFLELAGDVSLDPALRERYLNASIDKMKSLRDVASRKAQEIRGGTYYKPQGIGGAQPAGRFDLGDGFSAEIE